jgi:isopenicillin N synthase-like dioxygenase
MIVYTEPKAASHIPVIDLAPSFTAEATARASVAAQIRSACRDTGFFYVANHGIERSIVETAFAEANRFFDRPDDWKMRIRKQHRTHGYEPLETQRLDNASPADLKESFNFAAPPPAGTPDATTNLWPTDLPGFREGLEAYYERVLQLGLHISRLIALSLQMPVDFFDAGLQFPTASLRLLRYPPQPDSAQNNQLGAGAHTDWGWITLLAQDDRGGLEVETASGDWIRAEPIPDTFVVNLGDLVARWTNGLYHSNMHRVMNNRSGKNRHSLVLFYNPAYDTHVECLPTCLEPGEVPKFPPCTSGEHIAQRGRDSRRHLPPDLQT